VSAEHDPDVPGIAIVRSSRSWARTLHRYVVDHGGAIVRARPLEERQALEEDYDLLLVDDISSFLSNRIVDELHRRGRRVLGVFDPEELGADEEQAGKQRLVRLGVDGVIAAQATPEEFVRAIDELAPARMAHVGPGSVALLDRGPEEDRISVSDEIVIVPPRPPVPRRRGRTTVVIGAGGGCGATEVSIELARGLGRRGERAVVIDGDELAPSLAQRLNLGLHPNVRTAVDVVEHGTGRLAECLVAVAHNLEVLVGLPHPKDWVELRGSEMAAVVEEITRGRPQVVVNAAPCIENLAPHGGPDRFGMSRAVIAAADAVAIVCQPTPTGISRLLDRVSEVTALAAGKPIHVVVNRTQRGSFKRNEIAHEIQRSFVPAGIHFLPADPRVERAAWEGTLVPSGDFTKAVASDLVPSVPRTIATSARPRTAGARPSHFRSTRKGA